MELFSTPYLGASVGLDEERERHILLRHPDLLPEYRLLLGEALLAPDRVRRSARDPSALLFSKFFPSLLGGKRVVVVVVTDPRAAAHRIITAYITRRIVEGNGNV